MSNIRDISISFVDYFLPQEIVEWVKHKEDYDVYQTLFQYCTKAIQLACDAYKKGNAKAFDPNPGDAQCQARSVLLYQMFNEKEIADAFEEFSKKGQAIQTEMGKKRKETQLAFFERHFVSLTLPPKAAYLLGCFVAATVRVPHHQLPNGVIVTHTSIAKLATFVRGIDKFEKSHRERLVDHIKSKVCFQTLEWMRTEVEKIGNVFAKEKPLLQTMYSDKHIVLHSDIETFQKKPIVCQFFSIQAAMYRACEEQMLVAFKSIETKNKPFFLFYRSQTPGGSLEEISENTVASNQTVVVCEGVCMAGSKEALAETIKKVGFVTAVLAAVSNLNPFHSKSTISDIQEESAIDTIRSFQEQAKQIGSLMELDHFYSNFVGKEVNN